MFGKGKNATGSISRRILIVGLTTLGASLVLEDSGFTAPGPPTQLTTALIYEGHSQAINALVWSPDSKHIASSGKYDKTIQVWNATTVQNILTHDYSSSYGSLNALSWSPDGKYIASSNGIVEIWDATSGETIFTNTIVKYPGYTYAIAWSSDSTSLACGEVVSSVRGTLIWDITHKRIVLVHFDYSDQDRSDPKSDSSMTSVAWSPDNRRIASANTSQSVEIWDTSSALNIQTLSGHSDIITSVAWSPDGKYIASGSYDATVRIWNATTGKHILTYSDHPFAVYSVAWSPDSKYVVSGSYDKTAQVWAALTGVHISTFTGHTSYVYAVAWSPDGKCIASGGQDKTVQVWQPL